MRNGIGTVGTSGWASWVLLLGCLTALVVVRSPPTAEAIDADEDDLQRGGELYQRWCATCHATDGTGTRDGPALDGLGLAEIDLSMRTGRMPLGDPERGVRERDFDDTERELTNAYLAGLLDLEDDIPVPPAGDIRHGHELYAVHCAACHGATGRGGVSGEGTTVPTVLGLDRTTLASAIRVGPFAMPPFSEDTIDEQGLGDVVDYMLAIDQQPRTPLGLIELNRVSAAAFAAILLTVLIAVGKALGRWRLPPKDDEEASTDEHPAT